MLAKKSSGVKCSMSLANEHSTRQLLTHLLVDLGAEAGQAKAGKGKSFELQDEHRRPCVNSHALAGAHFLAMPLAPVLVGPIQVLRRSVALQRAQDGAGMVNVQGQVDEQV